MKLLYESYTEKLRLSDWQLKKLGVTPFEVHAEEKVTMKRETSVYATKQYHPEQSREKLGRLVEAYVV